MLSLCSFHRYPWLLGALVIVSLGCTTFPRTPLQGTTLHPELRGEVQLEQVEGGAWMVSVAVDNLPPPERLGGQSEYIVWVGAEGRLDSSTPLQYSTDHRAGRAMVVAEERPSLLVISAERSEHHVEPSEWRIVEHTIGPDQ